MSLTVETRHCNCCGSDKPAEDFYRSYKTQCRSCLKAKALTSRDEKLAYLADWRARNPSAANDWYRENHSRKMAYNQAYYETNRAAQRARYDEWSAANPDRVRALGAKRTAAKLRAIPSWIDHEAVRQFYKRAARLTAATGIRHDVDHQVPLQSKIVCGLHWEGNLQILTKTDNLKKSNKQWADMPC